MNLALTLKDLSATDTKPGRIRAKDLHSIIRFGMRVDLDGRISM
jgi:hypothetical protein